MAPTKTIRSMSFDNEQLLKIQQNEEGIEITGETESFEHANPARDTNNCSLPGDTPNLRMYAKGGIRERFVT